MLKQDQLINLVSTIIQYNQQLLKRMTSVQVKEKSGFIHQKLLMSDGLEQGSYEAYSIIGICDQKLSEYVREYPFFGHPVALIFTIIDISIRIFNISSCVSSHHLFLHKVASLNSQIRNIAKCSNVKNKKTELSLDLFLKPSNLNGITSPAKHSDINCFKAAQMIPSYQQDDYIVNKTVKWRG